MSEFNLDSSFVIRSRDAADTIERIAEEGDYDSPTEVVKEALDSYHEKIDESKYGRGKRFSRGYKG